MTDAFGGPTGNPDTAELDRLNYEVAVLEGRTERARQAWVEVDTALRATRQRRDEVAWRLAAGPPPPLASRSPAPSVPGAPSLPVGSPVAVGPSAPSPFAGTGTGSRSGPETSTRTVQNVLFILGGLLLAAASVVFTAVAWTTFGVAGRAAILAVVTGCALAAPLVALRRRLTATAETFAALGLLLVLLDGYAAWKVNLFGVAAMPAPALPGWWPPSRRSSPPRTTRPAGSPVRPSPPSWWPSR